MNFILRFISAVVISSIVAGCSLAERQPKILYEGQVTNPVYLEILETLPVDVVDTVSVSPGLIGGQQAFLLAPGEHSLLLRYEDVWDVSSDDHDKISSPLIRLRFVGQAGKRYQLRHKDIKSIDESRTFATRPELQLVELPDGKTVDFDFEISRPRSSVSSFSFVSEPEYVFASETHQGSGKKKADVEPAEGKPDAVSALNLLKFSWGEASPEQRKAFLEWVKENP